MSDPLGAIKEFYEEYLAKYGTGIAGAFFGIGWWAFIDGIVIAPAGTKIGFTKCLPGILATLALILINAVRMDELSAVDPWDDQGVYCRSRVWLLLAYIVCGGSIAGGTVIMLTSGGAGLGLAVVIQVACILASALLFFVSRSEGESDGTYGLL